MDFLNGTILATKQFQMQPFFRGESNKEEITSLTMYTSWEEPIFWPNIVSGGCIISGGGGYNMQDVDFAIWEL